MRDYERDPNNRYTYCIRSIAIYECLSYASDGAIRRQRLKAVSHGTGFAYREQGGETYLLTNHHVTEWPQVTDAHYRVEDVPSGCKRVSDALKIVDNENDDYVADDVPLSRVVGDEALDASVVKARGKLRLMPYRIGRAELLTAGDVVLVRGFPLGVFQAVNIALPGGGGPTRRPAASTGEAHPGPARDLRGQEAPGRVRKLEPWLDRKKGRPGGAGRR